MLEREEKERAKLSEKQLREELKVREKEERERAKASAQHNAVALESLLAVRLLLAWLCFVDCTEAAAKGRNVQEKGREGVRQGKLSC